MKPNWALTTQLHIDAAKACGTTQGMMTTAKSAPPGNGFIQRQRNNRSAQHDAEHAEKNIDNGDPNAGQKLWASQILKIFKAVPFFKALNDVGITQ